MYMYKWVMAWYFIFNSNSNLSHYVHRRIQRLLFIPRPELSNIVFFYPPDNANKKNPSAMRSFHPPQVSSFLSFTILTFAPDQAHLRR